MQPDLLSSGSISGGGKCEGQRMVLRSVFTIRLIEIWFSFLYKRAVEKFRYSRTLSYSSRDVDTLLSFQKTLLRFVAFSYNEVEIKFGLSLSSIILFYRLKNQPCPIAQHLINPICEGQETILPRRETRKQPEWAIRLGCCVRALEEQRDSIKPVVEWKAVDTYSAGNAFSPAGFIETLICNAQKAKCVSEKQSMHVYKNPPTISLYFVFFFFPT